jgi:hypothetical protein
MRLIIWLVDVEWRGFVTDYYKSHQDPGSRIPNRDRKEA